MRHLAHPVARTPRRPLRHAVVLGGSVVGLLAARVLSDQFEHVTLIERDELADRPEPRKGVPQGNHLRATASQVFVSPGRPVPGEPARSKPTSWWTRWVGAAQSCSG